MHTIYRAWKEKEEYLGRVEWEEEKPRVLWGSLVSTHMTQQKKTQNSALKHHEMLVGKPQNNPSSWTEEEIPRQIRHRLRAESGNRTFRSEATEITCGYQKEKSVSLLIARTDKEEAEL